MLLRAIWYASIIIIIVVVIVVVKFFSFVSKQLLDENVAFIMRRTFSTIQLYQQWASLWVNQDNDCKLYLKEKIRRRGGRNFKQYLNNFLMFSSCWSYVKELSCKQNYSIKRLFQCWLFDNGDKETFSSWFLHFSFAL